jgi:hypothetical protein
VADDDDTVEVPESDKDQPETSTETSLQAADAAEGSDAEEPKASADDEFETVDIGGKSYKVPRELKDGYLMQGDYTRKTQELAEHRRSVESEREAFHKAKEAYKGHLAEVGRLAVLDENIAAYAKVDWAALQHQDANEAQRHWMVYQQLKDQRDDVTKRLTAFEQNQALEAQQANARRIEEGQRELARDIKNWGPDLAGKLVAFAKANGISEQGLRKFEDDPAAIKLLHKAWLAENVAASAKAATKKASESEEELVKPLTQVSKARTGPPPASGPSDRDSIEDWMAKRNAQIARKNRAQRGL